MFVRQLYREERGKESYEIKLTFSFATIKCVDVKKHRTFRMYSNAVLFTSTKLPTFFGSSDMSLKIQFMLYFAK